LNLSQIFLEVEKPSNHNSRRFQTGKLEKSSGAKRRENGGGARCFAAIAGI
jgi:hypothetical protein